MAKKKKQLPGTMFGLHGFSRVQLKSNGEVVGDSGWIGPNMIVNGGIQQFMMNGMASTTGGLHIGGIAVGSGGTTASDATSMAGEYGGTAKRHGAGNGGWAVATSQRAASNGTATLQISASWSSSENSGASDISNIGLFDMTTAQGSLFAANTFASSAWNTNQDLYASYQIRLSF